MWATIPGISALRDGYETYVVVDACADLNPWITQVTTQRLAAAKTQEHGHHPSDHVGQYYAAMNGFLGLATNAKPVTDAVGLTGHPPIPTVGG